MCHCPGFGYRILWLKHETRQKPISSAFFLIRQAYNPSALFPSFVLSRFPVFFRRIGFTFDPSTSSG